MKKTTAVSVIALSLVLAGGNLAPQLGFGIKPAAAADKEKGKGPTVSPKVGKPLQEAQQLIQQKKFKDALAKLQEVEQMPGKSPYETFVTNQLALQVDVGLQDWAASAKALEAMLASGQMPADEVTKQTKLLVTLYYQAKDYPKTIEWATKYNKDAQDPEVQVLVGQAYYIQKNFKTANDALRVAMKYADAKGIAPKKDWLDLMMSAAYEQGDTQALQQVLEMAVQRFPEPKYWQDLLTLAQKNMRSGSTKTTLDIDRLMLLTNTMKDPNDFMEMAEVALQQGLPGESKKVMEKGMQSGVLGQGSQKDRQQRLLNMATTQAATDQKQLDTGAAEADKQKTGDADVKFGEAYWSYGQNDKAIDYIQKGIAKGVTDKDDAQLRLGIAYITAGKRQQGLDAFKPIPAASPTGQIARLWSLYSASRQSASAQ